ncbi:MAG: DMT family transporter [Chloroflexota bacterium]
MSSLVVRYMALAALIAVLWGVCFVLIQASLPSPAPLLQAGMRALLGGTVVGAAVLLRRTLSPIRTAGRDGGRCPAAGRKGAGLPSAGLLVLLALANGTLAFGAMYLAAGRAEAAVASVLASGQPVLLAAAGWLWFGERGSWRSVAGLSLGLGGMVLVAGTASGAATPDGVALALLATIAPTGGTLLMRRLAPNIDLVATAAAQFLLGGAILVGVSAILEPWSNLRWSAAIPGLLVLGVLGTGFAYVGWFWLLGRLPLVILGAALFLVPVTGVAVAIGLGDRPSPVELTGMAVAIAGIGLVAADPALRAGARPPISAASAGVTRPSPRRRSPDEDRVP